MIRRFYSFLMLTLAVCGSSSGAVPMPAPPVPQQEIAHMLQHRKMELDLFAAEARQMEHNLAPFGTFAPYKFDLSAPMPEAPKGHSAVVSDGGLLFDNAASCLSYIGNVRLNDERLQLRAAHRLYVRLPEKGGKAAEEPQPAAPPTPNEPAPSKPALSEPPAQSSPKSAPAPPPSNKPPLSRSASEEPGLIIAENAAVDLRDSKMLLEGLTGSEAPSLSLSRGSDRILLHAMEDGSPAQIFADYQGDVLMQGRRILLSWHDKSGAAWQLEAEEGPLYFKAAQHCLVVLGKARMTTPGRTMETDQALYITFLPEEATDSQPNKISPFAQFFHMSFKDVETLDAFGNVLIHSTAEGERPFASAQGKAMHYEAATGKCRLVGEPLLHFGENSLHTQDEVELLENGDAVIHGTKITGSYIRPFDTSDEGGETTRGNYTAKGPITYDARSNCVLLPSGISARDPHGYFTSAGRTELYLKAKDAPPAPRTESGMRMPNLTIAQQSELSRIVAQSNVRLHSDASATTEAYTLSCDKMEADAEHATLTMTAAPGARSFVNYGAYELTTQGESSSSTVKLLDNGDIEAAGEKIYAKMPGDSGDTRVICTKSLLLQREQNLITIGEDSCIRTPEAIMTARAPLKALMAPGENPAHAPSSKYPHLVYNFGSLHRATTTRGGTLRTTQASMQCEGAIEIELKPDAQMNSSADARQNLRSASAENKVQVASKDATGRLLRAEGDRLTFDATSGNFYLRGKSVTLVDAYNTHTASGKGACITIDPENNVSITGEKQITTASKVKKQLDNMKKQK